VLGNSLALYSHLLIVLKLSRMRIFNCLLMKLFGGQRSLPRVESSPHIPYQADKQGFETTLTSTSVTNSFLSSKKTILFSSHNYLLSRPITTQMSFSDDYDATGVEYFSIPSFTFVSGVVKHIKLPIVRSIPLLQTLP
jgi:hypothetical protein